VHGARAILGVKGDDRSGVGAGLYGMPAQRVGLAQLADVSEHVTVDLVHTLDPQPLWKVEKDANTLVDACLPMDETEPRLDQAMMDEPRINRVKGLSRALFGCQSFQATTCYRFPHTIGPSILFPEKVYFPNVGV
jgi:hypothetical protein